MPRREHVAAFMGITGVLAISIGLGSIWGWQGTLVAVGLCLFFAAVALEKDS
jgi:hypothetical protein